MTGPLQRISEGITLSLLYSLQPMIPSTILTYFGLVILLKTTMYGLHQLLLNINQDRVLSQRNTLEGNLIRIRLHQPSLQLREEQAIMPEQTQEIITIEGLHPMNLDQREEEEDKILQERKTLSLAHQDNSNRQVKKRVINPIPRNQMEGKSMKSTDLTQNWLICLRETSFRRTPTSIGMTSQTWLKRRDFWKRQ